MELVDGHYQKLSKDIYEDYEFDYDAQVDQGFQPKYTSIYSLPSMLAGGYRKIFSYSIIKKDFAAGFCAGVHVFHLCRQQYRWDHQYH